MIPLNCCLRMQLTGQPAHREKFLCPDSCYTFHQANEQYIQSTHHYTHCMYQQEQMIIPLNSSTLHALQHGNFALIFKYSYCKLDVLFWYPDNRTPTQKASCYVPEKHARPVSSLLFQRRGQKLYLPQWGLIYPN